MIYEDYDVAQQLDAAAFGEGLTFVYARALIFAYAVKDPLLCAFLSMLPTQAGSAASRKVVNFFGGTLHFRAIDLSVNGNAARSTA